MTTKSVLIPFLCFIAAVTVLYARSLIPHAGPSDIPSHSPAAEPDTDTITLHYHERPPYYITGPLGVYGLCSDPAKQAFTAAGIRFRWEKTPAARQLDILKANRSRDCLIGWFKNAERERFAKYSDFIYQDKPTIAIARSDNGKIPALTSIEAVLNNPELTLLVKGGYSYGRFIDAKINTINPKRLVTESENIGMLRMIHSGRADYFFISEEEAVVLRSSSGLLETDLAFIHFTDIPPGNKRYLLFSRNVEDAVIEKINAALKQIVHGVR